MKFEKIVTNEVTEALTIMKNAPKNTPMLIKTHNGKLIKVETDYQPLKDLAIAKGLTQK